MKSIMPYIVIFLVGIAAAYILFECQFQTYIYKMKTDELNQKIDELGCYEDENINSTYHDVACPSLIEQHNEVVASWQELSCVG